MRRSMKREIQQLQQKVCVQISQAARSISKQNHEQQKKWHHHGRRQADKEATSINMEKIEIRKKKDHQLIINKQKDGLKVLK